MTITERMIWAAANVLIAETPMNFDAAERLTRRMLAAAEAADPNPLAAADIRAVDWWADGVLEGQRRLFGGE